MVKILKNFKSSHRIVGVVSIVCVSSLMIICSSDAAAAAASLGVVAATVTSSLSAVTKLITAGSYVAGLAFSIGAIMKFKQHKDNPTQVPIGTPVALVFIAAALLFLPSILGVAGSTMFGGSAKTAGPSGAIYSSAS